jgi:hypothetical protein
MHTYTYSLRHNFRIYRVSENSGTNGNFVRFEVFTAVVMKSIVISQKMILFNGNFIYYLHYMLHMFTPTLCAFFKPLCHVCAGFALNILGSTVAQQSVILCLR